MSEQYSVSPEQQVTGWEPVGVEDSDGLYRWLSERENGRYEVTVSKAGTGFEFDYTDRNEVAYCLMGSEGFEECVDAFRFAMDFMEGFEPDGLSGYFSLYADLDRF